MKSPFYPHDQKAVLQLSSPLLWERALSPRRGRSVFSGYEIIMPPENPQLKMLETKPGVIELNLRGTSESLNKLCPGLTSNSPHHCSSMFSSFQIFFFFFFASSFPAWQSINVQRYQQWRWRRLHPPVFRSCPLNQLRPVFLRRGWKEGVSTSLTNANAWLIDALSRNRLFDNSRLKMKGNDVPFVVFPLLIVCSQAPRIAHVLWADL